MNTNSRDKIFKSWKDIPEETLIKKVSTDGDIKYIKYCKELWSHKHRISLAAYEAIFQDFVTNYVRELLAGGLVLKAENVLRNVNRDVKCVYFQFACECEEEQRDAVVDHLKNKKITDAELQELQFQWQVLQQLKSNAELLEKYKGKLPKVDLEAIFNLEKNKRTPLLAEIFYANPHIMFMSHVGKTDVWHLLVDEQKPNEIVRWCFLSDGPQSKQDLAVNALEQAFLQWPIEEDMYVYALRHLLAPNEVLRNYFAQAGHFFKDESSQVETVIMRIANTASFEKNQEILNRLPLGRSILERGYYMLLLRDFVSEREIEELLPQQPANEQLLKLILTLKQTDPLDDVGFPKLLQVTKSYLESCGVDFQLQQPLVTLLEFLCHEPNVPELHCQMHSHPALKHVPYLRALAHGMDQNNLKIPTGLEFLRRFRNIDLPLIGKHMAGPEIASFSNSRLCQNFARRYPLNYLHYLKQQRSAYAVYYFLIDMMQKYAQISPVQLYSACQAVTELALQQHNDTPLQVHCVAFCEILGFDTQNLRCFLRLLRRFCTSDQTLKKNGHLTAPSYAYLFAKVERALLQQVEGQTTEQAEFPLSDYQALMHLVGEDQQNWPQLLLQWYAKKNDWWRLVVLLQYFEIPITQLRKLCAHFENHNMGENFYRALLHEVPANVALCEGKRRRSFARQYSNGRSRRNDNYLKTATSGETLTSSMGSGQDAQALFPELNASDKQLRFLSNTQHVHLSAAEADSFPHPDIFATLLLCSSSTPDERITNTAHFLEVLDNVRTLPSMSGNLLRSCVKQRLPILAVLAAASSDLNNDWDWLVWLAIATDEWSQLLTMTRTEGVAWVWRFIQCIVRQGMTAQLQRSFNIFFEQNPLMHFFNFLHRTQNALDFSEESIEELRHYLLALNTDEVELPLCPTLKSELLMKNSIKLLLIHLQHNFSTIAQQKRFLSCICRSGLSDISNLVDFCRLHEIFKILHNQKSKNAEQCFDLQFEQLLRRDNNCYDNLLVQVIDGKAFDCGIQLATLLQLPCCPDIIYQKWLASCDELLNDKNLPSDIFQQYEREIFTYSLPPSMLVDFLLTTAKRLDDVTDDTNLRRRYRLLKQALCVIKRHHLFPNECFDRDQIEYEMTHTYLRIDVETSPEEIYHSEYYEQIMLKERCVLYKSLLELKELAGIEDLNIQKQRETLSSELLKRLETLLNSLLEEGDIVEALRLQVLFECPSIDVHFVIYCMALAEGISNIISLSTAERKYFSIEKYDFLRFNKLTLENLQDTRMSPSKQFRDSTDLISDKYSTTTYDFEEIPAKEKRETLETIQGIVSKLRHGLRIGKRILMIYRAAMYLDKEYLDLLRTKDVSVLLRSVAAEDCLHRLVVVSDVLNSTGMTVDEIAALLAHEITTAVVRPRFYLFSTDQHVKQLSSTFKNAYVWGHNIDKDLHLFFELTPNVTKLGYSLLQYCDALKAYRKYQDGKPYEHNAIFAQLVEIIKKYGMPSAPNSVDESASVSGCTVDTSTPPPQVLSHKKQNIISVELLIKAHQCFVHECSMEGIASILNRAKTLNSVLTKAKSWTLIVRLLTGIARYREMFYCFDSLIENAQFESLLGQFEDEKSIGLRQAIICYLRENAPENAREYLKLAALHFLMYKELAEMWEQDARSVLDKILANNLDTTNNKALTSRLKSNQELVNLLQQAVDFYAHATENCLLDNKLLLAQKHAFRAELVAVQLDLASKALAGPHAASERLPVCLCVINVQSRDEFRELINRHLNVPQALILSRAYDYDINWTEVLLTQYVLLSNTAYLNDYLSYMSLTDAIIENIVKGFQLHAEQQNITQQMEQHLEHLVDLVKSVTLKYKLASVLAIKPTVMALINGPSMYYLKDTDYGRKENHNLNDI